MRRAQRIASALLPILAFCLYLVLSSYEENSNAAAPADLLLAANIPISPPQSTTPNADIPEDIAPSQDATIPAPPSLPNQPENNGKTAVKRERQKIWAVVTAYCPCSRCCGIWANGRTSIGLSAWRPGVAADPRAVPYGTRLYIEGYGEAVVDDTGGILRRTWRRKGQIHLDVRMTYHWQARQWGRREMWVEIIE